jgi:heat shock protein HslJ
VQVREVRVDDGRVVVELRGAGSDDPSCCPSMNIRQVWTLVDGALQELAAERRSARTTVRELEGSHWELARWSADEPAVAVPVVSLSYAEGRFSGHAGCNRYGAAVRDAEAAGGLVVSPGMATRMACEEPRMSIENRFLRTLPAVQAFRFSPGMLMLAYRREDGGSAELWFRPAAAP